MRLTSSNPPCEGLVVWLAVDDNEPPWPAVITACMENTYLLTLLGSENFTHSAKLHQLSTFECNLTHAIVPDAKHRTRLSVACAAALDHVNSEFGVPAQRAHLSSASYAKFLAELAQKVDELPEWPPSAEKPLSEDLPLTVQSALLQLYRLEGEKKEETYRCITAHRDVIDAELQHLAYECAAVACLAHKHRMLEVLENVEGNLHKFGQKRKEMEARVQKTLVKDVNMMKRKSGAAVFEERIRKKPILMVGHGEFVEEEVLDESGFHLERGDESTNSGVASDGDPASSNTSFYRVKGVNVDN